MSLTTDDVIEAFDSLGDKFVQLGALRGTLENAGHDSSEVNNAISKAIDEGQLAWSANRSLYRP